MVDRVHEVLHVVLHAACHLLAAQVFLLQRAEGARHGAAIVRAYLGGSVGHPAQVADEHRGSAVAAGLFHHGLAQVFQQIHLFLGRFLGGLGDGFVFVLQGDLLGHGRVDAVVGGLDFVQGTFLIQQIRQVRAVLAIDFLYQFAASFGARLGFLQGGKEAVQAALLVHQLGVHLLQALGCLVGAVAEGHQQRDQGGHTRQGQPPGVQLHHGIERFLGQGDILGGPFCTCQPQLLQLDGGGVGGHGGGTGHQEAVVFRHDVDNFLQPLHRQAADADHVLHHGLQPFAQFHPHLLEPFASLLQLGLHGVVLHVVFVRDAGAFAESAAGVLLLAAHQVDVACQGADDAGRFGSAELHFLQYGSDVGHAAHLVERLEELDDGLVGIGLHGLRELLHVHPGQLGKLGRFLVDAHDQAAKGGAGHLRAQHVLVEGGGESHDVGHGQPGLLAHAAHAGRELHQVGLAGRSALRHLVDSRADGQHVVLQAARFIAEHLAELAYLVDGFFAQVFAQRHIDLVCRFDELPHLLHAGDAQLARLARQPVQFLAGGAGVHLLELLVQLLHLVAGHAGVLDGLAFGFFHLGIFVHALPHGQGDAGQGGDAAGGDGGVAVEAVGHASQGRALCAYLDAHGPLGGGHLLGDAAVLLEGGVVFLRAGHGVLQLAAHLFLHGQQLAVGGAAEVFQHALGLLHLLFVAFLGGNALIYSLVQLLFFLLVISFGFVE